MLIFHFSGKFLNVDDEISLDLSGWPKRPSLLPASKTCDTLVLYSISVINANVHFGDLDVKLTELFWINL